MTLYAFLAIGIGAAFGAWLRWGFGLWFNPVLPALPLGTLAANLVGGYLIGLAIAFFPPSRRKPSHCCCAVSMRGERVSSRRTSAVRC